nr:hypothetical protein Itr_chr15CG12700 [Ipomoea trifida]GLL49655.1 hypothetical protein Itr_chr15CG12710 [Ipomoea trifida]
MEPLAKQLLRWRPRASDDGRRRSLPASYVQQQGLPTASKVYTLPFPFSFFSIVLRRSEGQSGRVSGQQAGNGDLLSVLFLPRRSNAEASNGGGGSVNPCRILPLRSSSDISHGDYGGDEELHTPFSPSRLLVPIFGKYGGYEQ